MNEKNIKVISNIIAAVESGGQIYSETNKAWTAYAGKYANTTNEVTCTLGPYQAYGDEAQELIRYIYDTYPDVFAQCDPKGIIEAKLTVSWVGTQWGPSDDQKAVLIKLLGTDAGHEASEHIFRDRLDKYLKSSEAFGVTEVQAQMMWVEIQHLGGLGAAQRVFIRADRDFTVDHILECLRPKYADLVRFREPVEHSKFWSRHQKCAEFVEKYAQYPEEGTADMATEMESGEENMSYDVKKLLDVAFAEVGYMEKRSNAYLDSKTANAGSNNYTKYGRDLMAALPEYGDTYGINYQWCDQFVDWCFLNAYGKTVAKKLLIDWSAYTPTSAGYYKKVGRYDKKPSIGAQIFFRNSVRICHTGIVYAYDENTVYTVEGNTNNGTAVVSNGGMVCKKSYARSNSRIDGYGHPDYGTEPYDASVSAGQSFLNKYYPDVVKTAIGHLLDVDNDFGPDSYNACLAVWKDIANRKYGAKLTLTNHNFGGSCKEVAKKMAVSKGCEGTLVWIYETMLSAYGFYTDSMDGAFGNNMDKAVRAFQQAVGLVVDGSLGADSVFALFNYKKPAA